MKTIHILLLVVATAIMSLFVLDHETNVPLYVFANTDQIGYVSTDNQYNTSKIDGVTKGFEITTQLHPEGILIEFITPIAVSAIEYQLDYDTHPNIVWTTSDGIHWQSIVVEETAQDILDSEFQIFTIHL